MKVRAGIRRKRTVAAITTCLMLLSGPGSAAEITTVSEARRIREEVQTLRGRPSTRVFRRTRPRIVRWRRDRAREKTAYVRGLQTGRQQVLAQLSRTRPKPPPRPDLAHRQNLMVRFVDPRHRPIRGLRVTPVVTGRDPRGTLLAEQRLPDQQTDTAGRLALRNLKMPCAITWEVPDADPEKNRAAEWSFRDVRQASLQLSEYKGAMKLAASSAEELDGPDRRSPYAGILLASASLDVLQVAQRPRTKIAYHDYNAGEVVLERTVVDFRMAVPSGTKLYGPEGMSDAAEERAGNPAENLETEIPVRQEGGTAYFRLPHSLFRTGPMPLRVARESDAAEWESVVRVTAGEADPYAPVNEITVPPLKLVRLKQVEIKEGIDVLAYRPAVESALRGKFDFTAPAPQSRAGEPRRGSRDRRRAEETRFGAEWIDPQSWWGRTPDMDIRFRALPTAKVHDEDRTEAPLRGDRLRARQRDPFIADLVRLKTPEAGSLAGIAVGESDARLTELLGEPQSQQRGGGGRLLAYLDGGVIFQVDAGKVAAIDVQRPADLLKEGTTAFAPRTAAKVCLADFDTQPRTRVQSKQELAHFLKSTGVVQIVNDRDDADYLLSCRLEDLDTDKEPLNGAIPLKVKCRGTLSFSLEDTSNPGEGVKNGRVTASGSVDWYKEAALWFAGILLLRKLTGDGSDDLVTILGGTAAYLNLQRSMNRAAGRMPRIVEARLYDQLASRLYETIDSQARVAEIDYDRKELIVPLGTRDGVTTGRLGSTATAFDVYVAGTPLPGEDTGLKADYYAAEVVNASETTSRCRLKRIRRSLTRKQEEDIRVEDASYMLARLPQAGTGVVSVRMRPALPLGD